MNLSFQQKIKLSLGVALAILVYLTVDRVLMDRDAVGIKAAFGAEFLVRPDGLRGLRHHYDLHFPTEPIHMADGLLYQALARGAVDVIDAFSTDGRIQAYDLVVLEDDRAFFPPYYAAPLVRRETLLQYPQLGQVLGLLANAIDPEQIQAMNYQVDEKGVPAAQVARDFLQRHGLLSDPEGSPDDPAGTVVVGSKEFAEQEILGEMLALLIEHHTNLIVKKRLNLGGTLICFKALQAGDLDVYPEYTGTGLVTILKHEVTSDPQQTFTSVREAFEEKYGLIWLEPFGFNNTYALVTRNQFAQTHGLKTITDLKHMMKAFETDPTTKK